MNKTNLLYKVGDYLTSIFNTNFIIRIVDIKCYAGILFYDYIIIHDEHGKIIPNYKIFDLPYITIITAFKLYLNYKLIEIIDNL
jgi:hypothetical protein